MKKALQLAVILMAFLPAISFGQATKNVWPEMQAFNDLLSASFQPVGEGNYEPLKTNADKLFEAVKKWKNTTIPQDRFKPAETKDALRRLVIEVAAVQKAVIAHRPNDDLKTLITKANNTFHSIEGYYVEP